MSNGGGAAQAIVDGIGEASAARGEFDMQAGEAGLVELAEEGEESMGHPGQVAVLGKPMDVFSAEEGGFAMNTQASRGSPEETARVVRRVCSCTGVRGL